MELADRCGYKTCIRFVLNYYTPAALELQTYFLQTYYSYAYKRYVWL